jgi:hypothetical protein
VLIYSMLLVVLVCFGLHDDGCHVALRHEVNSCSVHEFMEAMQTAAAELDVGDGRLVIRCGPK